MLTKNGGCAKRLTNQKPSTAPCLNIAKLGIVSRDFRNECKSRFRGFGDVIPEVLRILDVEKCDSVLFSLYSLVQHDGSFNKNILNKLQLDHVKTIFLEEYLDGEIREIKRFVVYHTTGEGWSEYAFMQKFGSITAMPQKEIQDFVKNEMPKRILGNCCVLLCGETNGVKYSPKDKNVKDTFGVRAAIPKTTNIVLNPIHDRMTRFEMKLKRQFLSEQGRWVVSVWNKGKKDNDDKVRDGKNPAWTVYHNGQNIVIPLIQSELPGIEIGILEITKV